MRQLRLADAILLGDSLKARNPLLYYERGNGCGCAIAGAFLAVGQSHPFSDFLIADMKSHWPWVTRYVEHAISDRFFSVFAGKIDNPSAVDAFELGAEYLVTFTKYVAPQPKVEAPVAATA